MRTNEYTANLQLQPAAPVIKQAIAPITGKCGNAVYPLGAQIASTIEVHGVAWGAAFYASRGVPLGQFLLLARGAGALQ